MHVSRDVEALPPESGARCSAGACAREVGRWVVGVALCGAALFPPPVRADLPPQSLAQDTLALPVPVPAFEFPSGPPTPSTDAACAVVLPAPSLDDLLPRLSRCQQHAPWLAWVGDMLQRAGRLAEAAELLERALLIDPDLLAAQLGYVLALAASGDTGPALDLARQVLARPDLPAAVAGMLKSGVARWQAALAAAPEPDAPWRTSLQAALRTGHDSNPLGSPDLDSLTLLIGGDTLTLPLDPSQRRRGGSYLRVDAGIDALRVLGDTADGPSLLLRANVQRRASQALPAISQSVAQWSAELTQRVRPSQPGGYLTFSGLELSSTAAGRYRGVGAGAGWRWRATRSPCQASAGLELQRRLHLGAPDLHGRYTGIVAQWRCDSHPPAAGRREAPLASDLSWQLQMAQGTDRPLDPTRAGGGQRQSQWRLSLWRGAWLMDLELERRHDATRYSPLLGPEARRLGRQAVRLQWQGGALAGWPGGPVWGVGVDWSRQRANLALFDARGWGPFLTLRHAW